MAALNGQSLCGETLGSSGVGHWCDEDGIVRMADFGIGHFSGEGSPGVVDGHPDVVGVAYHGTVVMPADDGLVVRAVAASAISRYYVIRNVGWFAPWAP